MSRWNRRPDGCTFCVVRGSAQRWLTVVAGLGCVIAVTACGTTRAHAHKTAAPALAQQFQTAGFLDSAGNPEPAVYAYTGGGGPIDWSMCAPGASKCKQLAVNHGIADPGPQSAGTLFKVRTTLKGQTYSTALRWRGALRVASPPTLTGLNHVGATVRVSPARWAGGWGSTEYDDLGIEACRTARAAGCVMLAGVWLDCSASGCQQIGSVDGTAKAPDHARVGNWYTGWYLFALDARLGNPISLAVGYASAAAIKPWPSIKTIARSQPYGPVTGPPAPKVTILSRTQAHDGHVPIATIDCAVSCRVATSVETRHPNRDDRSEWSTNDVVRGTKPIEVSWTIPAGRASVTVQVGNGPYVKGHSLIRR
jgi:hypothetical protein